MHSQDNSCCALPQRVEGHQNQPHKDSWQKRTCDSTMWLSPLMLRRMWKPPFKNFIGTKTPTTPEALQQQTNTHIVLSKCYAVDWAIATSPPSTTAQQNQLAGPRKGGFSQRKQALPWGCARMAVSLRNHTSSCFWPVQLCWQKSAL